jgi:hypothetical protein
VSRAIAMRRVVVAIPALACLAAACRMQAFVASLPPMPIDAIAYRARLKFSELEIVAAAEGLAMVDVALVRGLREWRELGPAADLIAEQGRIAARVMGRVGREARRQLMAAR